MESSFLGSSQQPAGTVSENDRILAILTHILTFFFGFLVPLVIYLVKKDESPFVREHAKESLNFQLTMLIAYIVSFILVFVIIGILMLVVVGIAHLVLVIVATIRAADNQIYRYPFSIKFVK